MNEGFIIAVRRLMNDYLWEAEEFTKGQARLDLYNLANYEDGFILKRGIKIPVKRGQVGVGKTTLAKRWKWSRTKVSNFLDLLEEEHQIRQQKNNVSQVITILDYEETQTIKPQKRPQKDRRSTAEVPQKNSKLDTKKDRKKTDKKDTKETGENHDITNNNDDFDKTSTNKSTAEKQSESTAKKTAEVPQKNSKLDSTNSINSNNSSNIKTKSPKSADGEFEDDRKVKKGRKSKPWDHLEKELLKNIDKNQYFKTGQEWHNWLYLALWMHGHLMEAYPGNSDVEKADFKNWFHPIRKMVELDGIDLKEISRVWLWVRKNSFWRSNILSPSKLRDKLPKLQIKIQEELQEQQNPNRKSHEKQSNTLHGRGRTRRQKQNIDEFYDSIGAGGQE